MVSLSKFVSEPMELAKGQSHRVLKRGADEKAGG